MRLHRFYISEPLGNQKEITVKSASLVNQVRRVFRLKTGDRVIVFDGSGSDFVCEIMDYVGADKISLLVKEVSRARYMPARKIYLYASVIKKDLFELIVEKATELGVTDIIPVITDRTEKKSLNDARLNKISVEASEQSGRGDVPNVHPMTLLADAVNKVVADDSVLPIIFHTEEKQFDRGLIENDNPLALFVGPEGGWSPEEVDLFHKNNLKIFTLGPQVLRAETAVVAALSQVVFTQ